MGPELWTLASLCLAVGAGPSDTWATNQRSLSVPIKFIERRSDLQQMVLYVSKDQGKKWEEAAVAPPDKENFPFFADTDGLYWMKLCTVYRDGTRSPKDITQGRPALKILVDTLKPTVRILSAERKDDGVVVRWEIQEDHPDLGSLKLEYHSLEDATHQWFTVPVEPALNGSARFRFVGSGAVAVRLQLRDTAGNAGIDNAEVGGATVVQGASPSPILPTSGSSSSPLPPMLPSVPLNPPPSPAPVTSNPGWENPSARPAPVQEPHFPNFSNVAPPSPTVQPIPTSPSASGPRVIGTSDNSNITQASAPPPEPVRRMRGPLPARQVVNDSRISLQYSVKNKGPSGIGLVEVWHTTDEGQTWKKLTSVPQPAPQNAKEEADSSFLPVELPGEGVYGLRLVVLSRAGRGKPPPHAGDGPEMVIEVDQTPPRIVMQAPQPDTHHPNTLMLLWNVSDPNLTDTPITLQWAESRSSTQWKTIAANAPNTGRYPWRVSGDVPTHVFLRLVAQDKAGNVSESISEEAILVDLSEPEARLIGVIGAATHQP